MRDSEQQSKTKSQLIKFSIVGFSNVGISFIVFYFCYQYEVIFILLNSTGSLGESVLLKLESVGLVSINGAFSNMIGYAVGMINSFVLNKLWTFKIKSNTARQAHRFIILNMIGLGFSTLMLLVFVDAINWPHIPVWLVSTVIVMVFNFIGNKYWAFSESKANL